MFLGYKSGPKTRFFDQKRSKKEGFPCLICLQNASGDPPKSGRFWSFLTHFGVDFGSLFDPFWPFWSISRGGTGVSSISSLDSRWFFRRNMAIFDLFSTFSIGMVCHPGSRHDLKLFRTPLYMFALLIFVRNAMTQSDPI